MRWSALFDDLEAQLLAEERAALRVEVAEHTRSERGRIGLVDRLSTGHGRSLGLRLTGGELLEGRLAEVAADWVGIEVRRASGDVQVVVRLAAIRAVHGLPATADPQEDAVRRRLDLRHAVRAISRDRRVVRVDDVDGVPWVGTIDRVGRDHLDLGRHPQDVDRRPGAVRDVAVLPYGAIATVRTG